MKNQNGFSLISVLIAIGLMAALALGMMKLNEINIKRDKASETKRDFLEAIDSIKMYFSKANSCENTWAKKGFGENQVIDAKSIINHRGEITFKIGQRTSSGLTLKKLELYDYYPSKNSPLLGTARLKVEFKRPKLSYGSRTLSKIVELDILLDDKAKIEKCALIGNLNILSEFSPEDIEAELIKPEPERNKDIQKVIDNSPELKSLQQSLERLQEASRQLEKSYED